MRALILILLAASAAMAQADTETVNITVTRTVQTIPDQFHIYVYVVAPPEAALTDVLAQLQGTGLTAADLQQASGQFWTFQLTGALSELKNRLPSISRVAQAHQNGTVSYNVSTQVSPAASKLVDACPAPTMVSQARAQAQSIAAAAGVSVGPIVSLQDSGPTYPTQIPSALYAVITGVASARLGTFLAPPILPSSSSCSITVQFKLVP